MARCMAVGLRHWLLDEELEMQVVRGSVSSVSTSPWNARRVYNAEGGRTGAAVAQGRRQCAFPPMSTGPASVMLL